MIQVKVKAIGDTLDRYMHQLRFDELTKRGISIIEDKENPEFVIVNEWMYFRKGKYMDEFLSLPEETIKIFLAGEAVVPDFNLFDYAFSFEDMQYADRNCRIPTKIFFASCLFKDLDKSNNFNAVDVLKAKTGFAEFLYSNPNCPERNEFFHKLSKYGHVDSAGKCFNNMNKDPFEQIDKGCWRSKSIEFKSKYKFSIAFENASHCGYTSEKILTSMQANSIPIYWGNPDIAKYFNTKSFINCHDFNSFEEVISYIKKVDTDDSLYCEMMSQPWQTKEQLALEAQDNLEWDNFIFNLFSQMPSARRRKAQGFYQRKYFDRQLKLYQKANRKWHHKIWKKPTI